MIKKCTSFCMALLLCALAAVSSAQQNSAIEMVIQKGHSTFIDTVAFSPDGRYFISSGSYENTVKLWDFRGQLIRVLADHSGRITDTVFNSDGSLIAVSSGLATARRWENNTVKVWDLDGRLIRTIAAPGLIHCLAFSPVENILAGSMRTDKHYFIVLWDADGKLLRKIEMPFFETFDLAFRPDGKELACAGSLRQKQPLVKIISLTGDNLLTLKRYPAAESGSVHAVAFSPDGSQVVSGARNGSTLLWHADGSGQQRLAGPSKGIIALAFSRDGRHIAGASPDGKIYLWNRDGRYIRTIEGHTDSATGVDFSPDQTIVSCSADKSVKLWSLDGQLERACEPYPKTERTVAAFGQGRKYFVHWKGENVVDIWGAAGKPVARIEDAHKKRIHHIAVSPDGGTIATVGWDKRIRLWGMDGKLKQDIPIQQKQVAVLKFTPDSRTLVIARLKKYYLIDPETLSARLFRHKKNIDDIAVSPDGRHIACHDGRIQLFTGDGRFVRTIEAKDNYGDSNLIFSPGGQIIATWNNSRGQVSVKAARQVNVRLWHIDGRFLGIIGPDATIFRDADNNSIKYHYLHAIHDVAFSPDGKTIACGGQDDNVTLWSLDGRLIKTFKGHSLYVQSVDFSPDGRYILSSSRDGTLRVWNVENGSSMVLLADGDEWVMFTPDGYFDASRNGGDQVAMVSGAEAFAPDQFAAWFNRPDLILKRFDCGEPNVINHYSARYKRRLKRMGIREGKLLSKLHVPQAELLAANRDGNFVELALQFSDDRYNLKRYNIYINDVPLFGAMGKAVTGRNWKGVEKIELSSGRNKVEIACVNEQGAESFRTPTLFHSDRKEKGDLYFIGFGVSRYQDSRLNLMYADKDVKDLAKLFAGMKSTRFNRVHIKMVLNAEVTRKSIRAAKQFLLKAGVNDTLVLFIAGHGVHDRDQAATYYYLTHRADVSNLSGTCARFEDIEAILQGIKPRQKLFLMDTCESGEAEDDDQRFYLSRAASGEGRARAIRGISVTGKRSPAPAKRSYLFETDRYIYNDLVRRSGAIVLSSSRGGEFSYEDDHIENGYFTEAIINTFSGYTADVDGDGIISIDELRASVSRSVAESTAGLQNPTVDRDNIYVKFGFPVAR